MGRRRRQGFTLVELLVVIAIIALLAGLLFPVFAGARARAHQTSCLNNLRQLGRGFTLYLDAWEDTFPNSWQDRRSQFGRLNHSWWDVQIFQYVRSDGVFRCPSNPVESYSVHQPFGSDGRKTRVVNYALNNQLLGCQASGSAFNYSLAPADPVVASRVRDPSGTIMLTEKLLDRPGHDAGGPDQPGDQSQEVDVWFHIAVPGMDPSSWDLTWGVPRRLHGARSNYLFVDGHVRSLLLRQTFEGSTTLTRPTDGRDTAGGGTDFYPPQPPPSAGGGEASGPDGPTGYEAPSDLPLGMWGLGSEDPVSGAGSGGAGSGGGR